MAYTYTPLAFAAMVTDIAPFVPGCPSLMIERTLKKIITDLCTRALVWREEIPPFSLAVGEYRYSPVTAAPTGELISLDSANIIVDGNPVWLAIDSFEAVQAAYPSWPVAALGQPTMATTLQPGELRVAPVPDVVRTCNVTAFLQPTAAAEAWDQTLYRRFARTIFHGVVWELQSMPERSWSDAKGALLHGRMWTQLLSSARATASKGYNRVPLRARFTPFA